ncbi:MAG: hypothetical protein Kow0037_25220 [Calditrichia bacterium]
MNKNYLFGIILLLFLPTLTFAQEILNPDAGIPVDTVLIFGNEKTHDEVILREIPFTFPDTLKESDFQLIQNRLTNLYLFSRVELRLQPAPEGNKLLILVTEHWYIFPLPILFINERDWSKISAGLQFTHFNFRGRNEKLSIGGWLGYNPAIQLSYYNPWLGKNARLILGTNFLYRKKANKIFDFDESQIKFSVTIGRQISLTFKAQATVSLQQVKLPEPYHRYSASGNGKDVFPAINVEMTADHRDLFEYPRHGWYVQTSLQKNGFGGAQPDYWRFSSDNRLYQSIPGGIVLAARNRIIANWGTLPIYDRSFLGFEERIRGYFDLVLPAPEKYLEFPSPKLMINTFEIRIPIVPIRYYNFEEAPIFSSYTRNLKFGISLGLFTESGVVWQERAQLNLRSMFSGFGAGIHFHLPYVNVLRLDRAWNDRGQPEWILEAGVSF